MEKQRDLKLRILALLDRKPQKPKVIREKLGIKNPNALQYWKIKMLKDEEIGHDPVSGNLFIMDKGRRALAQSHENELLDKGAVPTFSQGYTEQGGVLKGTELIGLYPIVDRGVPFSLMIIGDRWLQDHGVVDDLAHEGERLAYDVFRTVSNKVSVAKGFKNTPEAIQTMNRLDYIKDTYDFEITLSFRFNPRKALKGIDWEKAKQAARQAEERYTEELRRIEENMRKETPQEKRRDIRSFIEFEAAEQGVCLQHVRDRHLIIGTDEKDLMQKLVEHIGSKSATHYSDEKLKHFYRKNEFLDVFKEMMDHKEIEIVYFCAFRKRENSKSLKERIADKFRG